jgi:hypothetical protein
MNQYRKSSLIYTLKKIYLCILFMIIFMPEHYIFAIFFFHNKKKNLIKFCMPK